jgi:hypothetical protein
MVKLAGDHIAVIMDDSTGEPRQFDPGDIISVDVPLTYAQHDVSGLGSAVHHAVNGQLQAPVTVKGYLTTSALTGTHTVIDPVYRQGLPVRLTVWVGQNAAPQGGDPEYEGIFLVERYQSAVESGGPITFEAALRPASQVAPEWGVFAYLLRDDFLTADDAPIASPRPAEPGPGTLVLTDNDPGGSSGPSISGENYNFVAQVTPSSVDQGFSEQNGITRSQGLTLYARQNFSTVDRFIVCFDDTLALTGNSEHGFSIVDTKVAIVNYNYFDVWSSPLAAATDYELAVVVRSSGALYLIKGGSFSEWTLLYLSAARNPATLYAQQQNLDGIGGMRTFRVADLVANGYSLYDDDYGLALARSATPSNGESLSGEADGFDEITWTPAAGETLDIMVRRTDDSSTWSIVCAESTASNPDTIKIIERNGGNTERSSAAQTFAAGNTYRIVVRYQGSTIWTWVDEDYDIQRNQYASASFNQTETGGKVSGFSSASDYVRWPWTMTGRAQAALERLG